MRSSLSSPTWSRCLVASLAINGIAIGALGTGHVDRLAKPPVARVAKAEKKPTTRLMEIRLDKVAPEEGTSGEASSESPDRGESGGSKDEMARQADPSARGQVAAVRNSKHAHEPIPRASGGKGVARTAPNVDFGHRALTPPKPRVVPRMTGVIDLRNAHIKGTTTADPKLLAKHQAPNRLIGKSEIKVVGKATSLAKCVGAVGGNTIYGSKMTILLGKGIDIKGTKFCAPGNAPGVPGSGSSANKASDRSSQASKGPSPRPGSSQRGEEMGLARKAPDSERLRGSYQGVSVSATGPVRGLDHGQYAHGFIQGGELEGTLHLPAMPSDPTDRVRPVVGRTSGAKGGGKASGTEATSRFEPAPISVGSHSERGTIPWGPDTPKRPRPNGLKGDYYLGNDFESYRFTRVDPKVDFIWTDKRVDSRMPAHQPYSVRWTGSIKADNDETYALYTTSDDGVRLWVDGRLVIDHWTVHAPEEDVVRIPFKAGQEVPIRLEYFEINGLQIQVIKLYWESPSQPKQYVPTHNLFPPKP